MFKPNTEKIEKIARNYSSRISELESIFDRKTNVYIDYANVKGWQNKLSWHVDLKRLSQFYNSFSDIGQLKFYYGTLIGDNTSESLIRDVGRMGYQVRTKPVKTMRLSIDVTSISLDSPSILKQFIRKPLIEKLNIQTVRLLNKQLQALNQQRIRYLEDRKCNFDVEIGSDMIVDYRQGDAECFILWSGDSDFCDPIKQLLDAGKKVVLFSTARRVASELNELRASGLTIYDIKKIRNFICWSREMQA